MFAEITTEIIRELRDSPYETFLTCLPGINRLSVFDPRCKNSWVADYSLFGNGKYSVKSWNLDRQVGPFDCAMEACEHLGRVCYKQDKMISVLST